MHQLTISIPDETYATVEKQAQQEGFGNAEVFLADFIVSNIDGQVDDIDHLFTPKVMAAIEAGAEDARLGRTLSRAEVQAMLSAIQAEWLKQLSN